MSSSASVKVEPSPSSAGTGPVSSKSKPVKEVPVATVKQETSPPPKGKHDVQWGSIIPLKGGSSLGCQLVAGSKPLYYLSYPDFAKNKAHLQHYLPDIPYINLAAKPELP